MSGNQNMSEVELKRIISSLNIWQKGDQRAPHKPLLILYALSKLQNDEIRLISYNAMREDLKQLLMDFGPSRQSYHPEQPFVRLSNDKIWQLSEPVSAEHIKDNWLRSHEIQGGFTDDVIHLLKNNQSLIRDIAETVLELHFPESLHQEILMAVGLDLADQSVYLKKVKKRDPYFRDRILKAYGYSCAVCGFNVRLKNQLVGVEAAHIKWHQVGGPDIENNGLALCAMHHKLFDLGAFTIGQERNIIVSGYANGTHGLQEWLLRFKDQRIKQPIEMGYYPETKFVDWHVREVFKG